MRRAQRLVLIASLAALVGGCGSSSTAATPDAPASLPSSSGAAAPGSPSTGPAASAAPATAGPTASASATVPTAWDDELANVSHSGTRPLASSLRLFVMAFGPVPGVDAPPAIGNIGSATPAVTGVIAHLSELTVEQQAAITAALATSADAVTISIPPAVSASVSPVVAPRARLVGAQVDPKVQEAVEAAGRQFRGVMAGKLGGDIPGPINIILGGQRDVYGWAQWDYTGPGGSYAGCTVHVEEKAIAIDPLVILNTLAHEMFHCFEFEGYKSLAVFDRAPRWIVEGGAEWVGNVVAAPDTQDHSVWQMYLTLPARPLFERVYDGMGFFAHLDEVGTSPWSVFRAMFAAVDSVPAFAASGAVSDAFLDSWASGLLRESARGRPWDTTGPGITDDATTPSGVSVGSASEQTLAVDPYTNNLYALSITADVTTFATIGRARLSDGTSDVSPIRMTSAAFCTKSDGCGSKCPDGSPLPEALPTLGQSAVLALTGGPPGASSTITGNSLEDFCKPRPSQNLGVWVHIDRAASRGVLAGRVVDIVSCSGPFGSWSGVLRVAGIDGGRGFLVPFQDLPIAFTIQGTTARTLVAGAVTTPAFIAHLRYNLAISVDPSGRTMSITGTGSAENGMFEFSQGLADQLTNLPIEPAPPGRCP